jgi:phage baseplate assembly protein W
MTYIYKDLNPTYPTEDNQEFLEDLESIKTSLLMILNTKKGERLFRPEFGNSMADILHEPMSDLTAFALKATIIADIETQEARVVVDSASTEVIPDYSTNTYYLNIVAKVKGLAEGNNEINFQGSLST